MTLIEFDEASHTYLVDGILTPSVTQLIHSIWMKDMYTGVSKSVLERASKHGNKVHSLIEYWNDNHDVPENFNEKTFEALALKRYIQIQSRMGIQSMKQEVPVAFVKDGVPLYAGKFDILGTVEGQMAVVDIKTTSKLDHRYLEYQLTLYKAAVEQTLGTKIEKLYALWLPKNHLGGICDIQCLNINELINDIEDYNGEIDSSEGEDMLPF